MDKNRFLINKELTVSIVMFCNNIDDLTKVLQSTLRSNLVGKVYLIDNSPTDTLKILKKLDQKRIVYLFQNQNLGFGRAHNKGIKLSEDNGYKYHLILNPDIEFERDVLEQLHIYMESNYKCGIVMPKVLYRNGDLQYLCKKIPSAFEMFGKRLPIKSLRLFINNKLELHNFNYNHILNVPYLSGCFMFCRTSCFKKTGSFDDRYFMYMEDLDLSRTFHKYYETIYNPVVEVTHGYRSESRINIKLLIALVISAIKYYTKYGWFFDLERKEINKRLFQRISKLNKT
jgi:GT2 family glycosyltransferase